MRSTTKWNQYRDFPSQQKWFAADRLPVFTSSRNRRQFIFHHRRPQLVNFAGEPNKTECFLWYSGNCQRPKWLEFPGGFWHLVLYEHWSNSQRTCRGQHLLESAWHSTCTADCNAHCSALYFYILPLQTLILRIQKIITKPWELSLRVKIKIQNRDWRLQNDWWRKLAAGSPRNGIISSFRWEFS